MSAVTLFAPAALLHPAAGQPLALIPTLAVPQLVFNLRIAQTALCVPSATCTIPSTARPWDRMQSMPFQLRLVLPTCVPTLSSILRQIHTTNAALARTTVLARQ